MTTTFQDILEFMKDKKELFLVTGNGAIRAMEEENLLTNFCPITVFCYHKTGRYYPMIDYPWAAKEVGLDEVEAIFIAQAADDIGALSHREKMLEAIGAEPEE